MSKLLLIHPTTARIRVLPTGWRPIRMQDSLNNKDYSNTFKAFFMHTID